MIFRPFGPLAGLALLLGLLLPAPTSAQGVGLDLGTIAPDVRVQTLEGEEIDLFSLVADDEPVVIEFWATWCEQCEALQPQMDQIRADYGDRVEIVAVAVAVSQTPRRILRHLEDHDPGYPFVYDWEGNAVRAYNAATTAIVMILDADRRVVYSGVGTDQDLVGEVRRVLAGLGEGR